jgi:pyridinium-3,5-bisthiocarboxylic acid mononucleotide nickel chelatase
MLALLDCPTGLAGNMLLAALLDLGVPDAVVHAPLASLGLAGCYRLQREERRSAGLRGLHVAVESLEPEPPHRRWGELATLLQQAPLEPALRQRVLAVFGLLAEAEAAVHGLPPEQVHFHEVGAIDALVDVVGVCAALLHLGIEELVCSPPPAGHGQVQTAHGWLPLPAPAVLEIARRGAIPLATAAGFEPGELTTPTGLALAACWASRFGVAPAHIPQRVGVGLGSRALDRPNLVRLVLAAPAPGPPCQAQPVLQTVLVQQAQIDDASGEDLAHLAQALRQAGALEVLVQGAAMKKGRLGQLITVIALPELAGALRQVWWQHGSSLGVREDLQQRWALPRRQVSVPTPLGPVRLKQALLPSGRWRSKAEHDDLVHLAGLHGLALEQVRTVVEAAVAATEQPRNTEQP